MSASINSHGLAASTIPISGTTSSVAVYVQSFEPPTLADRLIVEWLLANGFSAVHLVPLNADPVLGIREYSAPHHRAAMIALAFQGMPQVFSGLDSVAESPFADLVDRLRRLEKTSDVWLVVLASQTRGGASGRSEIQTRWIDGPALWSTSRFIVVNDLGTEWNKADMPPQSKSLQLSESIPALSEVRSHIQRGDAYREVVDEEVANYIDRHRLFVPYSGQRQANFRIDQPRLKIVFDPRNPRSQELSSRYTRFESNEPNFILVIGGDGTMLHAIREHWRLRLPFLGLNTGHHGFLLNETLPEDLSHLQVVSYDLPMLQVDATTQDDRAISELAFSDTWIERAEGQAAWLQVDVDGETRVSKVVGDGMLVATAAGSSSYARAMGAIPVPLNTPVLTLVGSNVFQPRFWKPMALSDASVITIATLDHSDKRPLRGYVDGEPIGLIRSMTVRQSLTASVELAFTTEFDPSARLLRSLFPPDENAGAGRFTSSDGTGPSLYQ